LFKGYVGGFEPGMFWRREEDRAVGRGLGFALRLLRRALNHQSTRALRRANSRLWSGYALGIYTHGTPSPASVSAGRGSSADGLLARVQSASTQ